MEQIKEITRRVMENQEIKVNDNTHNMILQLQAIIQDAQQKQLIILKTLGIPQDWLYARDKKAFIPPQPKDESCNTMKSSAMSDMQQ